MMSIYTPWEVVQNERYWGPRIIDSSGRTVASFAKRWRGEAWAWEVAEAIVRAVNEKALIDLVSEKVSKFIGGGYPSEVTVMMRILSTYDLVHAVLDVADALDSAKRMGADVDEPEGERYIQLSDTLARELAGRLRQFVDPSEWKRGEPKLPPVRPRRKSQTVRLP